MKNIKIMMFLVAALAILIVPANAAIIVNESFPTSLSVFVPCAAGGAGEIVDLSGPLHLLVEFTINGNNFSAVIHEQPQGITGTGETTGLSYQETGTMTHAFGGSLQNGEFHHTMVDTFNIIGQGPNNNFLMHETEHITINANGTVTVNFDNVSIECN
jgi:hypothetical protein